MQEKPKVAIELTDTKDVAHTIVTADIFQELCRKLANKIKESGKKYNAMWPVPKNGLYVAQLLAPMLDIPLHTDANILMLSDVLVVDDLIDSGRTLAKFGSYDTAVLLVKNGKTDKVTHYGTEASGWIDFYWEKENDIEDSVTRILEYIGEDPGREGLLDTPARVVRSWKELYAGYGQRPEDVLTTTFTECGEYDEMVLLKNIDFYSTCEHHLQPFFGKIHISYIPTDKVVGLSKLARLAEIYARRLQIQERMTSDIARDLNTILRPKGVAVLVEAQHFCTRARGIKKENSIMVTSKMSGVFLDKPAARAEFMSLIGK